MSDMQSVAATEVPNLERARSLGQDAWRDLRHNWIFWFASAIALVVLLMAIAPSLFTPNDPADCSLSRQYAPGSGWALFGYDFQGCDIYARTVHGARASIWVGVLSTALASAIGLIFGLSSGFFGGWLDAILSRITDIVLGIPLLLAAIVLGKRLAAGDTGGSSGLLAVVVVLGILGWTTAARVMRSSVIAAKNQDYVAAARMLGAGNFRIMFRHILPNAIAPFIVVLTIALGQFIATEATLSFLGIGLKGNAISWGIDISTASKHVRESAPPLVAPSMFLAMTVLAFIMLGDAIRDAFDPKLR
ncbi:peptide/nickel transport system permease protein/oligopeptide transport system permease protein [Catenuloplanes nepalensis]|uniref:Peptide/nickel transport system permease protein/oligopeptide transport system permease protein n=1 Tax=Catenuloplanes nepalensis TaxID=587533 RepID=A0ABT9N6E4_9ACTN|nr:ABC transporter permease [Catenuloplanes nepalensis]MDP9799267.1 peptide/nickel transport system permease protein/oligopeptide transport system permease protein [Catenuloplanes nepalensis]